jgi:hypothetical protein
VLSSILYALFVWFWYGLFFTALGCFVYQDCQEDSVARL